MKLPLMTPPKTMRTKTIKITKTTTKILCYLSNTIKNLDIWQQESCEYHAQQEGETQACINGECEYLDCIK